MHAYTSVSNDWFRSTSRQSRQDLSIRSQDVSFRRESACTARANQMQASRILLRVFDRAVSYSQRAVARFLSKQWVLETLGLESVYLNVAVNDQQREADSVDFNAREGWYPLFA